MLKRRLIEKDELEDEENADENPKEWWEEKIEKLEDERDDLKIEMKELKEENIRLKNEHELSTHSAKQSANTAATASVEVVNCRVEIKQLKMEMASLVEKHKENIIDIEKKCEQLEFVNGTLRDRLHTLHERRSKEEPKGGFSLEMKRDLEEKVAYYSKSFLTERNKSKDVQFDLRNNITALENKLKLSEEEKKELNDKISTLETKVKDSEDEKQRMDYWLKQSNKECEVLINENKRQYEELKTMGETSNRIAEELKSSLEVRGKLNSNIDESEETLKMMKGRNDTLRDGMKCAEEYIKELENQIEEMKKCISPWDNGHPISHTPPNHRFPPYNQMTPPSPISPLLHAFRPNPNPFPSSNFEPLFNRRPFMTSNGGQFGPGFNQFGPNQFYFRM